MSRATRHGSSNGSDHAASLLFLERTAAEDLSGLPAGRSEDLSGAARSEHRKTCVPDAVSGAPIEPPPASFLHPPLPEAAGQGTLSARRRTGIEPAGELSP